MAQVKEQNPAQAQNNPNRNSESGGEKRTRTRRPYYNRRPRRAQQPKEAAVPIHIYPLGGLGEVGKNMTVYECNGDMIIVDCGLVFPDSEMYGVDMVIPDFTFVVQNKDRSRACSSPTATKTTSAAFPTCCRSLICPSTAPG